MVAGVDQPLIRHSGLGGAYAAAAALFLARDPAGDGRVSVLRARRGPRRGRTAGGRRYGSLAVRGGYGAQADAGTQLTSSAHDVAESQVFDPPLEAM